jgi:DNA primase
MFFPTPFSPQELRLSLETAVHGSRSPESSSFSVNLASHRYHCFRCGSLGNQIELWAAVHHVTIYQAAIELCQRASLPVPWIRHW